MNYKIIAIFTLLLLVFEILAGIPFGIWLAKDGFISNSQIFHLGTYIAGFVVEFIIFYLLFIQKINKPILHALIIGFLYWVIGDSLLYVLAGIKFPPLLVVIDAVIIVSAISLALYIAKIKGQLNVYT
ncbi:hypothetical protein [Thiohalophilus thiocyanatoxydans]|uniref:hypothetical protein n=1 Tax=Thiohalophilus thiocyanatoxydans TaxID=381308 RepID=UPI001066B221|nr:hypothetical protein [Thiohalophilus thiocyanatoxydans]